MRTTVLIAALGAAGPAVADDWPVLRHGMWEFNRTVETVGKAGKPQTLQTSKCTSPTEEFKRQQEMLGKAGCNFSPVVRTGTVFTYSAVCKMQGPTVTSKSVMTVDGDSAYTLRVDSDVGGESTRELLKARRKGDCPR